MRLLCTILFLIPTISLATQNIPNAKVVQNRTAVLIKLSEIAPKDRDPKTILKVRFDCTPLRYSSWIVSNGIVRTGSVELFLDEVIQAQIYGEKRGRSILALQDSKGESEKNFIDKLKGIKKLGIKYLTDTGKVRFSQFVVEGITKQIREAEELCFKD